MAGIVHAPAPAMKGTASVLHGKRIMTGDGVSTMNAGLAPHILPAWPECDQAHRVLAHPSPGRGAVPVPVQLDPLSSHTRSPSF